MRTDGKAELQHYVPQLLLRLHLRNPFASRERQHVWCFDKHTDRIFPSSIRNVLAGNRFYEIEIDGQIVSLEGSLSQIEGDVSPILNRIVDARTIYGLTDDERQASIGT